MRPENCARRNGLESVAINRSRPHNLQGRLSAPLGASAKRTDYFTTAAACRELARHSGVAHEDHSATRSEWRFLGLVATKHWRWLDVVGAGDFHVLTERGWRILRAHIAPDVDRAMPLLPRRSDARWNDAVTSIFRRGNAWRSGDKARGERNALNHQYRDPAQEPRCAEDDEAFRQSEKRNAEQRNCNQIPKP